MQLELKLFSLRLYSFCVYKTLDLSQALLQAEEKQDEFYIRAAKHLKVKGAGIAFPNLLQRYDLDANSVFAWIKELVETNLFRIILARNFLNH